eukprot:scaffold671892_cov69-Prasinocladus_malaysianus.AAC.1
MPCPLCLCILAVGSMYRPPSAFDLCAGHLWHIWSPLLASIKVPAPCNRYFALICLAHRPSSMVKIKSS